MKLNKKIAPEVMTSLSGIDDPSRLADTIAAHLVLKMEESFGNIYNWSKIQRFVPPFVLFKKL